jgi:ketosteroid isomerase-like protein
LEKQRIAFFSFCLLAFAIFHVMTAQENPLISLVKAELDFSKLSETKGIREAFLTCLAEDALVFRPGPVEGKKFYSEQKDVSGYLTWNPAFADVSLAGDLGYTTGPYEFRKSKEDKWPASYGHYVSIWRREKDGAWRVVIDVGVGHPPLKIVPPGFAASREPKRIPQKPILAADIEKERMALLDCDLKLGEPRPAGHGFSQDYFSALMPDVRLYRPNAYPYLGVVEARKVLDSVGGVVGWKPESAFIAGSGDLGATHGRFFYRADPATAEKEQIFHYVRIWKKSAGQNWRIALEVSNFVPSRPKA